MCPSSGPRSRRWSREPADFIDTAVRPTRTRDGYNVRTGPGAMPGPHDTYIAYGQGWANVSNTPFREYKHWVHEGGISTPLVVHWPAGIKRRGELVKQPGHLIDIMATCVDVAGAAYPKELNGQAIQPLEGKSLVPAFDGKPIEREAIYWEHEGNRAIRVGNWKLVAKGPAGAWELYDIDRDRTELHDLASQAARARQANGRPVGSVGQAGQRHPLDLAAAVWRKGRGDGNEQKAAKASEEGQERRSNE